MAENTEVPEGSIPPNATNGDPTHILMLTAEWQVDAYGMAVLTKIAGKRSVAHRPDRQCDKDVLCCDGSRWQNF